MINLSNHADFNNSTNSKSITFGNSQSAKKNFEPNNPTNNIPIHFQRLGKYSKASKSGFRMVKEGSKVISTDSAKNPQNDNSGSFMNNKQNLQTPTTKPTTDKEKKILNNESFSFGKNANDIFKNENIKENNNKSLVNNENQNKNKKSEVNSFNSDIIKTSLFCAGDKKEGNLKNDKTEDPFSSFDFLKKQNNDEKEKVVSNEPTKSENKYEFLVKSSNQLNTNSFNNKLFYSNNNTEQNNLKTNNIFRDTNNYKTNNVFDFNESNFPFLNKNLFEQPFYEGINSIDYINCSSDDKNYYDKIADEYYRQIDMNPNQCYLNTIWNFSEMKNTINNIYH